MLQFSHVFVFSPPSRCRILHDSLYEVSPPGGFNTIDDMRAHYLKVNFQYVSPKIVRRRNPKNGGRTGKINDGIVMKLEEI